MAYFAVDSNYC